MEMFLNCFGKIPGFDRDLLLDVSTIVGIAPIIASIPLENIE